MTGRMRIYPDRSVSGEFEQLGTDGFTGTLNDRQFAQLGALGLTGALADRFGAWDGEVTTTIDVGGGQTEELTDPVETVVEFNLTGGKKNKPAANDIVFALVSEISTSDVTFGNISGYTKAAELYANDDYDTNMALYYKVMSATPDTTITVPGSANKRSLGLLVFENVDVNTPIDLGIITVTATNAGQPNPGSITPVNAGAKVLVCGGSGAATVDAAVFTTSELSNFITRKIDSGSGSSHIIGMGVLNWDGVNAVDPNAFGGNTAATTASWGAFTVALRAKTVEGEQLNIPALIRSSQGFFFDPDDISTLYQDTALTSPVTAVGQSVAAWKDKSGNGYVATQGTAANRPIYVRAPATGRRNFFPNTSDLTAAEWTASNTTVAYEGIVDGQPAWRLTTITGGTISDIFSNQQRTLMSSDINLDGRFSVEFKPGNTSTIKLVIQRTSLDFDETYYNAATNFSFAESPANFRVSALADGWYKVSSAVGNSNVSDARLCAVGPCSALDATTPTQTTAGAYLLVRNPQYELNTGNPTDAQVVSNSGNLVTESGVRTCGWLRFRGTDALQTTVAVNFTGTDKIDAIAGFQRLLPGLFPILVELSADATLNNGAFALIGNANGTGSLLASLRGTTLLERRTTGTYLNSTVAKGAFGARFNIGGSTVDTEVTVDFNGDTATTTFGGTSAGTGNFGNHTVQFGRRSTNLLHYSGLLGPVFAVGRTLSAQEWTDLKAWMATRAT